MKIAICISGQPRFANFGSYHQGDFADRLEVKAGFSVDFYVQSWTEEGVEENQDKLFGHCYPKKIRIDEHYVPRQHPNHFHKIRGLSQHYAHWLCQSQIEDIDEYDVILRTRHDVMFNTDIMDAQIKLLEDIAQHKGVSGYGFYPDYSDTPSIEQFLDKPSHRGFSVYPSFDDWAIAAHPKWWKVFNKSEEEMNNLLDEMFMDPRNEHISATYDLDGKPKKVCIPELVWYNLFGLNRKMPFTVAKGFVYAARPSLKPIIRKELVSQYTPSDLRYALRHGWQNGGAVLQYSIFL